MAKSKAPVERKFVPANGSGDAAAEGSGRVPKGKGGAAGMRFGAVILWVVAIAFEVLTILVLNKTLYLPGNFMMWLIIGIGADLVCVVIGSLLWKKANRVDPASEKNKLKFFLWNQMGVIASIIAFLPLIVLLITNKDLDAKTKKIVTAVAGVALAAAIGLSIDYNPPSKEDLSTAQQESVKLGDGTVYWTRWGKSYHFDPNCPTLLRSEIVYKGTIEEAFAANRTDPCDFCAIEKVKDN
jgi:hypothetical protein